MNAIVHIGATMLVAALLGCSKQSPPQATAPSPKAIQISALPPGAEPYVFIVILTSSQPPAMRSVIAVTKAMKYEWHRVAQDGTQSTTRGVIPKEICDSVVAEWRNMGAKTTVDAPSGQAVYAGPVGGPHPPQVQRLLDYLSK